MTSLAANNVLWSIILYSFMVQRYEHKMIKRFLFGSNMLSILSKIYFVWRSCPCSLAAG